MPKLTVKKIIIGIIELYLRAIQAVFETAIFDFPPFYFLRQIIYQLFFNAKGGLVISRSCYFVNADFLKDCERLGKLKIGRNVKINRNVEIDYSGDVTIEDDVWLSQNVLIETHSHVVGAGPKSNWPIRRSPLLIEKDAWIGANAVIIESVNVIGRGAIIGAGAIVTKDVQAFAIVAGVPARKIKNRPEYE